MPEEPRQSLIFRHRSACSRALPGKPRHCRRPSPRVGGRGGGRAPQLRCVADDQAICVGYANNLPQTNHLPDAAVVPRGSRGACGRYRNTGGAGCFSATGGALRRPHARAQRGGFPCRRSCGGGALGAFRKSGLPVGADTADLTSCLAGATSILAKNIPLQD